MFLIKCCPVYYCEFELSLKASIYIYIYEDSLFLSYSFSIIFKDCSVCLLVDHSNICFYLVVGKGGEGN